MRLESIPVAIESGEGRLALDEGRLVGVLVRLGALHGVREGEWFLEAGFGRFSTHSPPTFPDLETAQAWFERS